MFKRILFFILISNISTPINPPINEEPCLLFCEECDCDLDDNFDFQCDNLIVCISCGKLANFIFITDYEFFGLCAKCYLE